MSALELTDDTIGTPDLRLLVALADLSENEREAFVDSQLLGISFEQISKRWGVSHTTPALYAARARHKLARLLFPERKFAHHEPGAGGTRHYHTGCRCDQCREASLAKGRREYQAKKISNGGTRTNLDGRRARPSEEVQSNASTS